MSLPIIDLHCDLLYYLEQEKTRTPYDLIAKCSLPQLQQGGVRLQVLALFTFTAPHSAMQGERQAKLFQALLKNYAPEAALFSSAWKLESGPLALLPAFENASGVCEEKEPLQEGFERLSTFIEQIGKPLYISLTWNTENRFGGGAHTQAGLKEDGKLLLEFLSQWNIAIDLSHASDALAYEIIDYLIGHSLNIPLLASHSNSRSVTRAPRNLPNEIALEIFRRKGLVGLNLYPLFVGETEEGLVKHIAYWLERGGIENISFGADFFYEEDLPLKYRSSTMSFFPAYQNAACYPALLNLIEHELKLDPVHLKKLAYQNALTFIDNNYLS